MGKFLQAGKIFLVNLVIIILFLLTVEGLVRWAVPEITPQGEDAELFEMHKFGDTYGYKPNMVGTTSGALMVTDSHGFRIDPTRAPVRKKKNLLVIGDSVSLAMSVDAAKCYPYLLDRKLTDYNIINASASGYGFTDYLNVLSSVIKELNIEGIVMGICLNDFENISQQNIIRLGKGKNGSYDSTNINEKYNEKEMLIRYPNYFVRLLRQINDNYFNFNNFMRNYSRFYLWMKSKLADTSRDHFLSERNAYLRLGIQEQIAANFKNLHDIVKGHTWIVIVILPFEYQLRIDNQDNLMPQKLIAETATVQNFMVIDLYDQIKLYIMKNKLKTKDLYLYNDPCHFSAAGHAIVAELIYQELLSHNLVN